MKITDATEHDVQVAEAADLLDKQDFSGAGHEVDKVLEQLLPSVDTIAEAAQLKGRSVAGLMAEGLTHGDLEKCYDMSEVVWKAFDLAARLNPCDQTRMEREALENWMRRLPPRPPDPDLNIPMAKLIEMANVDYDVIVVGAGAAGIGVALTLTETFGLDSSRLLLLERGPAVAESFRRWPLETRFISPSFNQSGWTNSFDLNSVAKSTSPAYSLHSEHPTGAEYASYLKALVQRSKLRVQCNTEVVGVEPRPIQFKDGKGNDKSIPLFNVEIRSTSKAIIQDEHADVDEDEDVEMIMPSHLTCLYVIWAGGEFQYPKEAVHLSSTYSRNNTQSANSKEEEKKVGEKQDSPPKIPPRVSFPGAELCLHNSKVRSYAGLPGTGKFVIIGGYESGIDAAFNLAKAGRQCTVLASTPCWKTKTTDPSSELAPYTATRLREVMIDPRYEGLRPKLLAPYRVVKVEKIPSGKDGCGFVVTAERALDAAGGGKEGKEKEDKVKPTMRQSIGENSTSEISQTLVLETPQAPLLCTGFEGSVAAVAGNLFDFATGNEKKEVQSTSVQGRNHGHEHNNNGAEKEGSGCLSGAPLLTEHDESTKVPGVFLVGPNVSHGSLSFCFVYKFRQRFGIVSKRICEGLGMDTRAAVTESRKANMYLEDLSCCTAHACGDVC